MNQRVRQFHATQAQIEQCAERTADEYEAMSEAASEKFLDIIATIQKNPRVGHITMPGSVAFMLAELANLGFATAGLIVDRRKLEREGLL